MQVKPATTPIACCILPREDYVCLCCCLEVVTHLLLHVLHETHVVFEVSVRLS